MRIVLHAGMHKTGSTAIQQAFCAHPPAHLPAGLTTPGGPRLNLSDDVQLLFQTGPALEKFRAARYGNLNSVALLRWRDDLAARWQAALTQARAPVFLISAEDLSAPDFSADALQRLVDFLRAARPDARIEALAYIRPPVAFMQSAFQQRVKEDKPAARDLDLASLWPGYRARLEKFDTVLGRDAVILRGFAPSDFPGGDITADLGRILGVTAPGGGGRANDSLSLQALAVAHARLAGILPADYPGPATAARFRALPSRALAGFGSGRFAFAPSLTAPVLAAQAADLDWMETRLGQRLSDSPPAAGAVSGLQELHAIALDSRAPLAAYVAAQPKAPFGPRIRALAGRLGRTLTRRDPARHI